MIFFQSVEIECCIKAFSVREVAVIKKEIISRLLTIFKNDSRVVTGTMKLFVFTGYIAGKTRVSEKVRLDLVFIIALSFVVEYLLPCSFVDEATKVVPFDWIVA